MKWTTKLSLAVAAAVLVVPTLTFAGSNAQFDRYPYRYRYEARREAREAMRDARQAIRQAHRDMLRATLRERRAYRHACRDAIREARLTVRDALRDARRALVNAFRPRARTTGARPPPPWKSATCPRMAGTPARTPRCVPIRSTRRQPSARRVKTARRFRGSAWACADSR